MRVCFDYDYVDTVSLMKETVNNIVDVFYIVFVSVLLIKMWKDVNEPYFYHNCIMNAANSIAMDLNDCL